MKLPIYVYAAHFQVEPALAMILAKVEEKLSACEKEGDLRKPGNPNIVFANEKFHVVVALFPDEIPASKSMMEQAMQMMQDANMELGSIRCPHDDYGIIEKEDGTTYTGCLKCKQPI